MLALVHGRKYTFACACMQVCPRVRAGASARVCERKHLYVLGWRGRLEK